jgi:hypothetical protein
MYLNEQTDRSLLEGLDPEEIHQVRTVMTQVALELGFAMGGKQPPEELREHVLVLMDESPSLAELKKSLAALLEEQIAVAPIGVQARRIQGMMDTLLTWSPKGLAMMQQFIDQWNKMREMQIELREENGRTIVSATLRVQPGQEVRLADVVTMQPRLVFRGESRITVLPDVPPAGISAFLFEPISEDGGVQLRFEGIAYGLVRLLAIPLADSTLREIRFFNGSVTRGNELVHVEMLMEATGRHDDPRRALIVHNTSRWRMIRRPFALEKRSLGSTTLFHYITPDRHYSYTYEGEPDEVEKPLTRQ